MKKMSDYTLHFIWPWWDEQSQWTSRERLLNYLRSGFVPTGCRIIVDYDGKSTEWDRDAEYAKPYRDLPLTPQLKKVIARQEEESKNYREWLGRAPKKKC